MNLEIKDFKKERTVYISNAIDEASVAQAKKDIQAIIDYDIEVMNHNYDEMRKLDNDYANMYMEKLEYPSIIIDLTSPGGSVYHGLALYDFISYINKETAWNIKCRASGYIASMATILILSCDERIGMKNTSYMIHSLWDLSIGKIQDIRDNLEECERLNELMIEIYTEKNTFNKRRN